MSVLNKTIWNVILFICHKVHYETVNIFRSDNKLCNHTFCTVWCEIGSKVEQWLEKVYKRQSQKQEFWVRKWFLLSRLDTWKSFLTKYPEVSGKPSNWLLVVGLQIYWRVIETLNLNTITNTISTKIVHTFFLVIYWSRLSYFYRSFKFD